MTLDETLKGQADPAPPDALASAARLLRVKPEIVQAILEIEGSGRAFNSSGEVLHRFEPHIFERSSGTFLDFLTLDAESRREKLVEAYSINPIRALEATSFGVWQIMGFNHRLAGYDTVHAMVSAFSDSEEAQLLAGARFIRAAGLDGALRANDWLAFAIGYNGSGNAPSYASRIKKAFERRTRAPTLPPLSFGDKGARVRALQEALGIEVDGDFGRKTEIALQEFQKSVHLKADGIAGAMTWKALQELGKAADGPPKATISEVLPLIRDTAQTATVASGGVAAVTATLPESLAPIFAGSIATLALVALAFVLFRHMKGS